MRTFLFSVGSLVIFFLSVAVVVVHVGSQELRLYLYWQYLAFGLGFAGVITGVISIVRIVQKKTPSTRFRWKTITNVLGIGLNGLFVGFLYLLLFNFFLLPDLQHFQYQKGDVLPDFAVPLKDLQDRDFTLASLRGEHVLLVYYLGEWCPMCHSELYGLQQHFEEISQYASIVAISPDQPEAARRLAAKLNLSFTVLVDPTFTIAKQYGIYTSNSSRGDSGYPTTIILDREGRIVWFNVSNNIIRRPDPDELIEILQSL